MTTKTPGKAVWAGFTTEPVDAPDSPIQDALPEPKPEPKPAPTPAPKPAPKPKTPATSSAPDVAAIMREVQYNRAKERSIPLMVGWVWLFLALVGSGVIVAATAIITDMLNR